MHVPVVLSTTLTRLLPLQLRFERFQYIQRSNQAIQWVAFINMSFSVRPWLDNNNFLAQ